MAHITIYTTLLCPYCHMATNLLRKKNAPFEEIDVTARAELREAMRAKAAGRNTVPQIFIGDEHVGGWDDLFALETTGRLDAKLTPRSD